MLVSPFLKIWYLQENTRVSLHEEWSGLYNYTCSRSGLVSCIHWSNMTYILSSFKWETIKFSAGVEYDQVGVPLGVLSSHKRNACWR